jgi:hypothetical protein
VVAPSLVELVEELRPRAAEVARALVAEELDRLAAGLNGAAPIASVGDLQPTESDAETAGTALGPVLPRRKPPARVPLPEGAAGPTTKTCRTCLRDLPATEFERHRGSCRECRRQQARERERRAAAAASDDAGWTWPF